MSASPIAAKAAIIESLEPRRLLSTTNLADHLNFAFPLGSTDIVNTATDAQGNVYVAGNFRGTIDFNPARRKHFNLTALNEGGDPFVAKYSSAGRLFWAVQISHVAAISGTTDLTANSLAADADGNVYVSGNFRNTTDFNPGAGVFNLTPGANADGDAFLLALDTNGVFRYAQRIPTPGTQGPSDLLLGNGDELATDAAGYIYLTDRVQDQPDLDPDRSNVTVTKFMARGRMLWTRSFADLNAIVFPHAMTVDAAGDVYLGGNVYHSADFDPGPAVHTLADAEFVLKLTTDGDFAWIGALGDSTISSLTTDAGGNVYVAGGYSNSLDFNFSRRRSFTLTAAGDQDAFLAKYAPTSAFAWAHSMGGSGFDNSTTISVAADGTVYDAGYFVGRAYFNPGVSRFRLTSQTPADSFFAALNPDGTFLTASQINPLINHLSALPHGGIIAGGFIATAGDVDPGPGVFTLAPVVLSQNNLFLLELV
jgi:hypothetical protein